MRENGKTKWDEENPEEGEESPNGDSYGILWRNKPALGQCMVQFVMRIFICTHRQVATGSTFVIF